MRTLFLRAPEELLAERARLGHDRWDELWDGELHVVPPPGYEHQTLGSEIHAFLKNLLRRRAVEVRYGMGVFRPGSDGKDYRVPDIVFFSTTGTSIRTARGLEGRPLTVLEFRSPDDETYEKFDFWAELGVPEIIVIEPLERRTEVYRLAGKKYLAACATPDGRVHAAAIDVRFSTVAGSEPRLRVECDGESTLA